MKIRNLSLRFLSLGLLLSSCILALWDGMRIDWWIFKDILVLILLVSAFVTVTYYNRWTALAGILVGCALETGIIFFAWQPFSKEGARIYNHVIPLVNDYYRTHYAFAEVIGGDSRYFLFFVLLLLGLWMGGGIATGKKKLLALFPIIACLSSGLLLGYAPGFGAVLCLIGGLGLQLLIMRPKETMAEYRSRQWVFLCLCAALIMTTLIYRPISEKALSHHEELKAWQLAQEDKWLDWADNNAFLSNMLWNVGGRESQSSLSNRPPDLNRKEILTVTVDEVPLSPIYLKNFTGAYYDSGTWYPPSEERFETFAEEQNMSGQEFGALLQSVDLNGFENDSLVREMTIELITRTGNTSPMPYFATLPENAEVVGDSGVRVTEENTYEMKVYSPVEGISIVPSSGAGILYNSYLPVSLKALEKYRAYEAYSDKEYTTLPQGQLKRLKENVITSVEDLDRISNLLNQCRYSFDLKPVPEGWDIVEYFLFEQKKGYCMHFASANTLLLRVQGIPARYASGYIVVPEDFKENEDGTYTATVRQERGHAWVEVLNSWQYWMPLEVTPPDYFDGVEERGAEESVTDIVESIQPEAAQAPEEDVPDQPEDEDVPGTVQTPGEDITEKPKQEKPTEGENAKPEALGGSDTDKQEDSFFLKIWPVLSAILKIFLGVGIVLALILLRAKYLKKRREMRMTDRDTRKAAGAIVSETLRLLRLSGIVFSGREDEGLFARDTEAAIEYFGQEEFTEFIEIARVARYSREALTEGQIQYLAMIYRRVKAHETERMKWYQKAFYKYVVVWI